MLLCTAIRRFLLIAALLLGVAGTLSAQSLVLFDIDASNFPEMRARFLVLDANGRIMTDFSKADFEVREEGLVDPTVISVSCPPPGIEGPFIAALVNDRSGSMGTLLSRSAPITRLDLLKEGNAAFVNMIDFSPPTAVAITAFDKNPLMVSDFKTSASPLLSAISQLEASGSTEYDAAFLDPQLGGISLLRNYKDSARRVLIFLTDGLPGTTPDTTSIINAALDAAVEIYVITIGMPLSKELEAIAKSTSGAAFGNINDIQQMQGIYRMIAAKARGIAPCEIRWETTAGCSINGLMRNVQVRLKPRNLSGFGRYEAPADRVPRLELEPRYVWFGQIVPPNSSEEPVTITARGDSMRVVDASIPPDVPFTIVDWGGAPPPFTLLENESRTIRVRFTPPAHNIFSGLLRIHTDSCPTVNMTLSGGVQPSRTSSSLKLLTPLGGEVFTGCDSVEIQWGGVAPTDPVTLEYSADNGRTWKPIARRVTGLTYRWIPPAAGTGYRIRVSVEAEEFNLIATVAGGGTSEIENIPAKQWLLRSPAGLATDGRTLFIAESGSNRIMGMDLLSNAMSRVAGSGVNGYLDGPRLSAEFWNPNDVAFDRGMLYIADYTNNRVRKLDTRTGSVTTIAGNGESGYGVDGEQALQSRMRSPSNLAVLGDLLFISEPGTNRVRQLDMRTGIMTSVAGGGLDPTLDNVPARSVMLRGPAGLAVMGDSVLFIAEREAQRVRRVNLRTGIISTVAGDGTPGPLPGPHGDGGQATAARLREPMGVTIYRNQLYITTVGDHRVRRVNLATGIISTLAGTGVPDFGGDSGIAQLARLNYPGQPIVVGGILYVPDTRNNRVRSITLDLVGGQDSSRSSFSVQVARLSIASAITSRTVDMKSLSLSEIRDSVLAIAICNTGALPLRPGSITMGGANPGDFQIFPLSPDDEIQPGDCRPIEIRFRPTAKGERNAFAVFHAECAVGDTIFLKGTGISPCGDAFASRRDFGEVSVGGERLDTLITAICNNGATRFSGRVRITSGEASFTIVEGGGGFTIGPGECRRVVIRFKPGATGLVTGLLDFGIPSECGPAETVLFGYGIAGASLAAPDTVLFPAALCFAGPVDTTLLLRNTGATPLDLKSIELTLNDEGFSIIPPTGDLRTIAPGAIDSIRIRFNPALVGEKRGLLRIVTSATDSITTIVLGGRRDTLRLEPSPSLLGFDYDASRTYPRDSFVVIRNSGTMTMKIAGGTIEGDDRDRFDIPPGQFPIKLVPGDSVRVNLRALMAASDRPFRALLRLVVEPTCDSGIVIVELVHGGQSPAISVTPPTFTDLVCTDDSVAESEVVLRNIGGSTLRVTGYEIRNDAEGNFSAAISPALSIPPGGTERIPVRFAPRSLGAKTADLVLMTNAPDPETIIPLSGRRTDVAFTLPTPDVTFEEVPTGASEQRQVIVRNSGSTPLTWTVTGGTGRFTLLSVEPSVTAPGETSTITLLFSGAPEGFYYDTLLLVETQCGTGTPVRLFASVGDQVETVVKLPIDSAFAGERAMLPVRLTLPDPAAFAATGAREYTTTISFLGTVLMPDTVIGATSFTTNYDPRTRIQTVTVQGRYENLASDTLFWLVCEPIIGDTTATPLDFVSFAWEKPNVRVAMIPGLFTLAGTCVDREVRLVASPRMTKISPLPISSQGELTIELPEWNNVRVAIVSPVGNEMMEVASGTYEAGTHSLPFRIDEIPSGVYTLVVETPYHRVAEQIVIVR